MHKSDNPYR